MYLAGMYLRIACFISILVLLSGCKHEIPSIPPFIDNGGILVIDECHPDSVYFQNQILPLFQSSCGIVGCHDAITAEQEIMLNSYENIMASGELTPFDLSEGKIYENITDTDPDDIMPPPPNNPLTDEQIQLIATWILQGAQNNSCDGCDYPIFSFSGTVFPLIQNKCEGCHSGLDPAGSFTLNSYDDVTFLVNSEYLMPVLNHETGYEPMPFNGNKLPQCEIDMVQQWIDEGAQNN